MMTPYGAHTFVNDSLKAAGLDKRIPPQMMYNYTKGRINAGKAPFIKYDDKTGVDRADLERWTKSYVAKKVAETKVAQEETATEETSAS